MSPHGSMTVLAALAIASVAWGQNVILIPVDDGHASDTPIDGVFEELEPDAVGVNVVDNGFSEWRAAFEFDISTVAERPGLAYLVLLGGHPETNPRQVAVHGANGTANGIVELDDFSQDDLQSVSEPLLGQNNVVRLDVTPAVQEAWDGSSTYMALNLREVTLGVEFFFFFSLGADEPTRRPVLEIDYVGAIFSDRFESADTTAWSAVAP